MESNGDEADLSVMPDDVVELGRLAARTAETMRTALGSVGGHVDGLLSGGWRGTAADSFGTGWNECRHGGNRIIDVLETLADALGAGADAYRAQDDDIRDTFVELKL
ncbi:WXG100 family type VII secretion target [Gordonia sp. DT218]|uniref:WXG100 family type VII secretion target n=1 Tax=Gordonia sp. DT218 TaxID=3416659 RepID=UPI003CF619F2